MPLIRDGMFNTSDFGGSGMFSPSAATGQQFSSVVNDMLAEEAKGMSSTTIKKGGLMRKKLVVSSKTQRGGASEETLEATTEQIEKLKKLIKKQ